MSRKDWSLGSFPEFLKEIISSDLIEIKDKKLERFIMEALDNLEQDLIDGDFGEAEESSTAWSALEDYFVSLTEPVEEEVPSEVEEDEEEEYFFDDDDDEEE